jgi:hypothetical protein
MYLSFPCSPTPKLGRIPVNAGPGAGSVTGRGTVYDLLVAGGRLYAPDFDGDVIRAMNLDPTLTLTSTVNASAGSQPDGIATAGGRIYVSSFAGAGVATFPANPADNSSATMLSPPSPLAGSYGITLNGSGGVIATGKDTANYAYVDAAGTVTTTSLPAGFEPFDAVTAPNGDVWLTDQAHTQIIRVVDGPPTGTASAPKGTSSTTAELGFSVDTHGNDTSWTVEYGTNTAYGKSVGATIAGGSGPVARNVTLPKLKGGKTYHLRLVATNARGTYTGPDVVLAMPKFAPGKPAFKSKVSKSGTELTSVKITRLAVGEKVALSCSGKGCPLKKKAYKIKKKGILDLTALFRGKVLKPGAKVVVKLSAKKVADSTTTLTVQPGKAPVVTLG